MITMTNNTQGDLFTSKAENTQEILELKLDHQTRSSDNKQNLTKQHDGTLTLHRDIFDEKTAHSLFDSLITTLNWQQPSIKMHGKTIPIPRKQVWMGDAETSYKYSGQLFQPEPWNPVVLDIKHKVERLSGARFNSVLCNLYRDGQDSVSWHADDEPELDPSTPIASFSLGATRRFDLKPKTGSGNTVQLFLANAMLVVMSPEVQVNWVHQIPKTKKVQDARINLTFRRVHPH